MSITIVLATGHGRERVAPQVGGGGASKTGRVVLPGRLLAIVAPVQAVAGNALLLQLHQALDLVLGLRVGAPAAAV